MIFLSKPFFLLFVVTVVVTIVVDVDLVTIIVTKRGSSLYIIDT